MLQTSIWWTSEVGKYHTGARFKGSRLPAAIKILIVHMDNIVYFIKRVWISSFRSPTHAATKTAWLVTKVKNYTTQVAILLSSVTRDPQRQTMLKTVDMVLFI